MGIRYRRPFGNYIIYYRVGGSSEQPFISLSKTASTAHTHTHYTILTLPLTYPIFTQIHALIGANQAIQDGYCLALQLSAIGSQHSSLQAALSKYEGIRKFPTAKITFNSWFLGFIETQRGIGAAVRDRFFNTMYRLGVAQVRLRRSLLLLLWVSLAVILTYCDALCIPQFVFLDGATPLHPKSQTLNPKSQTPNPKPQTINPKPQFVFLDGATPKVGE